MLRICRIAASAACAAVLAASPAVAEFKMRYPIVDQEYEFEHNGSVTFDRSKSGKNNNQSYTNEIGAPLTPYWFVELESEIEAPSGENLTHSAVTLESTFQLTPQGKYWADLGFFAEYTTATKAGDPNSVTFGPLIQKETPGLFGGYDGLHTLNILFSHDTSAHHSAGGTPLQVSWQSRARVHPLFEPGFEYYGNTNDVANPGKLADQQHRIGPIMAGTYSLAPYGKLKYEVGYLFGLTRATENGAARWRFEYEIAF